MQSLYLDLPENDHAPLRSIHLGFQSGPEFLPGYLRGIEALGVNCGAINLRLNNAPIDTTLAWLAENPPSDFD